MTNTASPTTNHTLSRDQFAGVWGHLDSMLEGDCVPLLDTAADSVDAVANALRDGRAVHADVMARLLDSAAADIRRAHTHLGCAIAELGELTQ